MLYHFYLHKTSFLNKLLKKILTFEIGQKI